MNLGLLTELQRGTDALGEAMAGYIRWIAHRYDNIGRRLPAFRSGMRDDLRSELAGSHPRTPDAAAALIVGLEALRAYAVSVGALGPGEAKEFRSRTTAGVVEAAKAHAEATKGGDPASRFVAILRSLFAAGRAYVEDRETGKQPPDWEELGWAETDGTSGDLYQPKRGAEFVGWADDTHLYLNPDTAYAAVCGFATRGGIPFGIKQRALWEALKRAGISLTSSGRNNTTARVRGNKVERVIQIPLGYLAHDDKGVLDCGS